MWKHAVAIIQIILLGYIFYYIHCKLRQTAIITEMLCKKINMLQMRIRALEPQSSVEMDAIEEVLVEPAVPVESVVPEMSIDLNATSKLIDSSTASPSKSPPHVIDVAATSPRGSKSPVSRSPIAPEPDARPNTPDKI